MWKIFGFVVIFGLAMALLKIAFLFLFIVGVLFKPWETVGVVAIFALLWLIQQFPAAAFGVLAILLIVGAWRKIPANQTCERHCVPRLTGPKRYRGERT